MAHPKTKINDVEDVFNTSLSVGQIQAHIDDAHLVIDEELGGEGLSDARLTLIEKYWAAGQAEMDDPRAEVVDAANTREELLQSTYFERAMRLDPTGKLKQMVESSGSLDWAVGTYAD